jgi:hypothetical protein
VWLFQGTRPPRIPEGGSQIERADRSTGGDPYFTINALEVFETQNTLTFSDWPSEPVVADGTTVDTITVTDATDGALYTVTADLGTIVGIDARTAYAGFQVQASGSRFTVGIRRPTGVGTGTPKIRVEEATGLKKGDLNQWAGNR